MPIPAADQIASEITSIQTHIGWMQDSVRLKNALNAVEDLQTTVNGMLQRIAGLRASGYVFEKNLEAQAADFARQWSQLHPPIVTQINMQTAALQGSLRSIELKMTQLNGLRTNPIAARPLINTITNEMQMLEDKARSAENTVSGMYDSFNRQVYNVKKHLDDIDYLFVQLSEAKFGMLPSEGAIRAVKSVWCKDVKERDDDPEGVLYLTDQRILFEQKEEVATKKILFITTAKQKVQELKWEIPIKLVDEVNPIKQGMLKNEDHLDIRFKESSPIETVHLHIWQDGKEWQALINKTLTGDFDRERAVAIDPIQENKIKAAPTQCPSCGANIDQVILRGQDILKCEYCGFTIRL